MTNEFIPFSLPDISDAEVNAAVTTLREGWITTGPKAKRFESEFSSFVGTKHALALNSCTAALHLALECLGIREGDEVIVPTMTFAATAEVVSYVRAKPVLADCAADTLNVSPEAFERSITPRTKAFIPVHIAGHTCEMESLMAIARAKGIKVVEDCAHAFPAYFAGRHAGTIGDIGCFSFYATKTLSTGEGGMAITANDDWADRIRLMSLHGISRHAWNRYSAEGSWHYEILEPGYKYNLTDIAAAIGIEQLKRAAELHRRRSEIAQRYSAALAEVDGVECPPHGPENSHAWHLYIIKLRLDRLSIDRARFIELMKEAGIGTSVHFIPLHLHPYYRKTYGYRAEDLPKAGAAFERIVSLPLYSKMTDAQVSRVIETVRSIASKFRR